MTPAESIEVILAPNPTPMTGKGTNTYVVGRGPVVVLDPGPAIESHLVRIEAAVKERGGAAAVVLTHHHLDHSESAVEVAKRLDAPLLAYPHDEMPPLDTVLADGDDVAFGGGALKVVHTPGHTSGHVALWWQAESIVFAGDLVAGEGYIVIDPPDGDMTEYLDSLRRIRELTPSTIRPGHGPAIEEPQPYLDAYIAHRLDRESKVLAALALEPRTIAQLLPVAYDDTPEAMFPAAGRSLVAHLEKLAREGRAEIVDNGAGGEDANTGYRLPG